MDAQQQVAVWPQVVLHVPVVRRMPVGLHARTEDQRVDLLVGQQLLGAVEDRDATIESGQQSDPPDVGRPADLVHRRFAHLTRLDDAHVPRGDSRRGEPLGHAAIEGAEVDHGDRLRREEGLQVGQRRGDTRAGPVHVVLHTILRCRHCGVCTCGFIRSQLNQRFDLAGLVPGLLGPFFTEWPIRCHRLFNTSYSIGGVNDASPALEAGKASFTAPGTAGDRRVRTIRPQFSEPLPPRRTSA